MNIGLIVYSQTGNTLAVAERLQRQFRAQGHDASLQQLQVVVGSGKQIRGVRVVELPDLGGYQALVLCSPVQGFSLAPAMKAYLSQAKLASGLPVALLMTQHFPYPWMGGKQAMAQFQQACRQHGAVIKGEMIVNWSNSRREQQIRDGVSGLAGLF